jgi:protein tyrosine/serine phosphatase
MVGIILTLGGGYLGALQLTGNFHTVIAGELYRSAQPTAGELQRYADRYGIRTVINLRGGKPGQAFYDTEKAEATKLGISDIDFPMSANKELSTVRTSELIALLKAAKQPILVHCKNGADRSGLASALFMKAVAKEPASAAGRQLSLYYGHVSFPGAPSYPMDESWAAYLAGRKTDQTR